MLHKINRVLFSVCLLGIGLVLSACSDDTSTTTIPAPTESTNEPRYAFFAKAGDDSVSSYVVDNATGRLKWIAKVDAGARPHTVAVDPSGRYAYVANFDSGNVSQYTIGADGSLTPMATATVAAGTSPSAVTTMGSWQ